MYDAMKPHWNARDRETGKWLVRFPYRSLSALMAAVNNTVTRWVPQEGAISEQTYQDGTPYYHHSQLRQLSKEELRASVDAVWEVKKLKLVEDQ